MDWICIQFYIDENKKHAGVILYEWLLKKAKEMGINGGSVFRAIAGFGRHKVIHEEQFFELGANVPVEIMFVVTQEQKELLHALLQKEKIDIFSIAFPVECKGH